MQTTVLENILKSSNKFVNIFNEHFAFLMKKVI